MGTVVSTTSGATVTQTQKIYGGLTSGMTAANSVLLCTLTLSGTQTTTNAIADACPVVTANFLFYAVVTSVTTTSGNAATGALTAMY